jgi:hypothetical protein
LLLRRLATQPHGRTKHSFASRNGMLACSVGHRIVLCRLMTRVPSFHLPAELSAMMQKAWEALEQAAKEGYMKQAEEEAEVAAAAKVRLWWQTRAATRPALCLIAWAPDRTERPPPCWPSTKAHQLCDTVQALKTNKKPKAAGAPGCGRAAVRVMVAAVCSIYSVARLHVCCAKDCSTEAACVSAAAAAAAGKRSKKAAAGSDAEDSDQECTAGGSSRRRAAAEDEDSDSDREVRLVLECCPGRAC